MNEDLNLVEILKDCPKGTKLYSPLYGEVEFSYCSENKYIVVASCEKGVHAFTKTGILYDYPDVECMIFPSKGNRDWSTFKAPVKCEFKPFDRVLARDSIFKEWQPDIFSHLVTVPYRYVCFRSQWRLCIPYEGNEYLLGTTDSPKGGKE